MGKGEMNKNEGTKKVSQPKRSRIEKDGDTPSSSNTAIRRQSSTRGIETKRPTNTGPLAQGPQQVL